MKKIMKLFVLVAAAAMALASCQTQEMEDPTPTPKEYAYVFNIGDADDVDVPETSATLGYSCVEWETGDQVGVYTDSQKGVSYNRWGDITPGSPAKFTISSYYALVAGDMVYCYYPYNSANSQGDSQDPRMVNLTIASNQTEKNQMPMVSLPYAVTEALDENADSEKSAGEIKLANLGSVIEFYVYSTTPVYQSELIQSVTFNADKAIAGDFVFDLTAVDYSNEETLAISGYEATSVVATLSEPVSAPATKDAAKVVKMVVAPGTYTGEVVVTTDKATYTYPISTSKEFKRSGVKSFGLNLKEENRVISTTQSHTIQWSSSSDWTDNTTKLISGDYTVVTAKNGGQTAPTVNPTNKDCRVYAKGTVTISNTSGNIQKLVFNISSQGKKRLAEITASVGAVTIDKDNRETVTWEGSAKSVEFTVGDYAVYGTDGDSKAGQLCFNSIDAISEVISIPSEVTLVNLEISGMTKEFVVGSEFVFDGKAYAVYSDEEKKDVTASVTAVLSDEDMSVIGSKTVIITYVEEDTTVTAEYDITVSENVADYSGTYAIVALRGSESYYYYLTNQDDGADTKRLKALVSGTEKPEDGVSLSATKLWNVAKLGNVYTIQSVDSKQFVSWKSGNSAVMADEGLAFTVEENEGKYSFKYIVSEEEIRYLSLNSSKESNYFAMYKGSQTQELYLIPAVEGEEVQPTVESIEVADYITSFTQGDEFVFGGKVTATLSNGVKVDVTESATFSGHDMETADVQTVTVTYEGKTDTYEITVTEKAPVDETIEWVLTSFADLKEGDPVVIVSTGTKTYAMSNDKGTSSAPTAVEITYSDGKLKDSPAEKIVWYVGVSDDSRIFYKALDKSTYLYCINNNNGLRVGSSNTNNLFTINNDYLFNNGQSRYLGVYYDNPDWRSYTSINNNITGQTFQFFVKQSGVGGETPDPTPDPEPEPEPEPEVPSGNVYTKYTGELVEGEYLIVYNGKAMNTTVSSDRLSYDEVSPVNDQISNPESDIVWKITKSGNYWTLFNESVSKYAASTGAKNKAQMLDSGTDDKSLWTVSGTETYEFVNKKNKASNVNSNLRNNGTYGFACYATSTGGALTLYKKN